MGLVRGDREAPGVRGDREAPDAAALGARARTFAQIRDELIEGLGAIATWHRWLYDGARSGEHFPTLEDFAATLNYLAAAQSVLEEVIASELRLTHRFSTWTEMGRAMHMTRQGVQQLSDKRSRWREPVDVREMVRDLKRRRMETFQRETRKAGLDRQPDSFGLKGGWARNEPEVAQAVIDVGRLRARRFTEMVVRAERAEAAKARRAPRRALKAQEHRAEQRRLAAPKAAGERPEP